MSAFYEHCLCILQHFLLTSPDLHHELLGRPWVAACIDVYTRCALGIYLGFQPPSALSVTFCLRDAFLPKPWLKEKYPDIQNDLMYGVMTELWVDQALENHSKQINNACYSVGVQIHFMPRRSPWKKGHIERFLGTLNNEIAHGVPGTTFSGIVQKGDYAPDKYACVKLSTIRWALRKWIADVYHQRPHRVLGISPAQMWRQSIRPEDIPLPQDPKLLDVVLGRPLKRKLTHKGIENDCLFYNSSELADLRMREGADLEVDISADDENVGHLYVIWNNDEIFEAKALRADYAEGLSRYEHYNRRKYQREHELPESPDGWIVAGQQLHLGYETKRRPPKKAARERDKGENGPPPSNPVLAIVPNSVRPEAKLQPLDFAEMTVDTVSGEEEECPVTIRRVRKG